MLDIFPPKSGVFPPKSHIISKKVICIVKTKVVYVKEWTLFLSHSYIKQKKKVFQSYIFKEKSYLFSIENIQKNHKIAIKILYIFNNKVVYFSHSHTHWAFFLVPSPYPQLVWLHEKSEIFSRKKSFTFSRKLVLARIKAPQHTVTYFLSKQAAYFPQHGHFQEQTHPFWGRKIISSRQFWRWSRTIQRTTNLFTPKKSNTLKKKQSYNNRIFLSLCHPPTHITLGQFLYNPAN